MNALDVVGLAKSFGETAVLADLHLALAPGELVAILGNSGSGKTTLLRLVCGFEQPDAGRIAIAGRPVAGPGLALPPERRGVGYVAQEGALFPHLTVAANVLFGLPRRSRDRHLAETLLARVGLPATYALRGPHQLSGGEQQRVALARAMAPGPRLVLLDEPFSALDAALRAETRLTVTRTLAEAGAAALLVTHDQSEALSLGHRVGVLRRGRLVQIDTPATLYRRPIDLELARFLGEAVVVPGEADGTSAASCLGEVRLAAPARGAIDLLVRPEQIRLVEGTAGTVCAVRFNGPDAVVEVILADPEVPDRCIAARVPGHAVPSPGATVALRVEGEAVAYPRII